MKIKVCANCNERYNEDDKYCRYCGAPYGKPAFIEEVIQCIYGPQPMLRKHVCKACGYEWETKRMVDKERYCPRCGGEAPFITTDQDNLWLL